MKLIIDIPWVYYNYTKKYYDLSHIETKVLIEALIKGTPIEEDEDCISHSDAIKFFDDCISRQAVLETIRDFEYKNSHEEMLINSRIKQLPSVTPAEKVGRWIIKDGKEKGYDIAGTKTWYIQIMCDKCGFIKTAIEGHTGQYKFCPNCGQPKMQEVENVDTN